VDQLDIVEGLLVALCYFCSTVHA